jgi:succinoglycan biosynthesis transport protein ExoP
MKYTLDEATGEITLRDMLIPLFRHRRIVILSFCSIFVCATLVAWLWAAQYYKATMQVVVEQDRSDPAITAAQNGAVSNNRAVTTDQVTSEVALLQGEDMLRAVVPICGLGVKWSLADIFLPGDPARRKAMKQEAAARGLAKKIKVEAPATSDVIDVSYGSTGEPELPACVLQTLSKLYLEKHLQLRRPVGSSDFFTDETQKYQQALVDSEARLVNFSRKEGVAAPETLRADMAQQVANSEAALHQAQQAIAADEKRIESIKAQMSATPSRSSTAEVSNSSNLLLQNLQASLLDAQIKRTRLLLKYDPSYPLVQEADQEIAETQDAIAKAEEAKYVNRTTDRDPTYEFLREDEAKTEADLASQKATAAVLADSIRSMRLETVKLDTQAVKQGALVREVKADEGNYLLYLNKREQELTSDALDKKRIANVAIAVPAVVPLLPAHSPWLIMLLGFLVAVAAGVTAGFVAEYLDPSFRTPAEVIETLRIPVLASVPRQAA